MKNKYLKVITALTLTVAMVLPMFGMFMPSKAKAAVNTENAVVMDVERFTIGQGFFKEPVWVPFEKGDNAATLVKKIIGKENFVGKDSYMAGIVGADMGVDHANVPSYITRMSGGQYTTQFVKDNWKANKKNALSEFTYGSSSGWCYFVNNDLVNYGISAYTPKAGDVLRFQYTLYGNGEDLTGITYGSGEKTADISNKDQVVKAMADANALFDQGNTSESLRKAYDEAKSMIMEAEKSQRDIDGMAQRLNAEVEKQKPDPDVDGMLSKVEASMLKEVPTPGYENSWYVMDLARGGAQVPQGYFKAFGDVVYKDLDENNGTLPVPDFKRTEYSRTIIALTAIGENASEFGAKGFNLFNGIADLDAVKKQGTNGPIWALVALNSHPDHKIPTVEGVKNPTTEQGLIDTILSQQLADGGWALFGSNMDADLTGMALYALAPYYNSNATVKSAIDKAVNALSNMQGSDGSFGSMGQSTSESCSQVIVALCALGINPDQDARFVKNGTSVLDALKAFYVEENGKVGFKHVAEYGFNSMATEQAYYALNSYKRLVEGKNTFFDMSDVNISGIILGDVNGDGKVNIVDIVKIRQHLVGVNTLTESEMKSADVSKDGKVNIVDVVKIRQFLVGVVPEL